MIKETINTIPNMKAWETREYEHCGVGAASSMRSRCAFGTGLGSYGRSLVRCFTSSMNG